MPLFDPQESLKKLEFVSHAKYRKSIDFELSDSDTETQACRKGSSDSSPDEEILLLDKEDQELRTECPELSHEEKLLLGQKKRTTIQTLLTEMGSERDEETSYPVSNFGVDPLIQNYVEPKASK